MRSRQGTILVSKIDSWEEDTNRPTIQVRGPEAMSAVADIAQHEARDLYLDGVAAALRGKRATAERLLKASLALNSQNHQAWLWLAGVVVKPEESLEYLERVLELAPNDPHAPEGIQWARQKLTSQQDAAARGVDRLPSEQDSPLWSKDSAVYEPTTPTQAKVLSFIWIALVTFAALFLLAFAAVFVINSGFPQSLLSRNAGTFPPPVETAAVIAKVNTPVAPVTSTAIPEPVGTPEVIIEPAAVPTVTLEIIIEPTAVLTVTPETIVQSMAVPTVTVQFEPPTRSPLTQQFIAMGSSSVVLLPSPMLQPIQPSAFRPGWYPASSPIAALRRSNWRSPIAPLERELRKTPPLISRKGKWIEVDIGDQKLRAFEDDHLVMEFVVSTGPSDMPTVQGQFHITSKYLAIDMSGPGYYVPAVPHAMFFHEGYSIHGAYWHNLFGQPTGHGCVNMKPEEAKKLFEWSGPALPGKAHSVRAIAENEGTLVVVHE